MINNKDQIIKQIQKNHKIAVISHENTDGDGLGSVLAVGSLLEKLDKQVSYFSEGGVPEYLDFVDNSEKIQGDLDGLDDRFDLYILCDIPVYHRIGEFYENNSDFFNDKKVINIDHHISNSQKFEYQILDHKASSTCEVIYEYLLNMEFKEYIDKQIANFLYLGIHTDTGRFAFNTRPQTFQIVSDLLDYGASRENILFHLKKQHSLKSLKFLSTLIDRIEERNGLIYTYFTKQELADEDISKSQSSYVLRLMRGVQDGIGYILFYQTEDGEYLKGSIRTDNEKANTMAQKLGGGGHPNASGFKVSLDGKDYKDKIQEIIKKIG